jgi:hypothetical protein
MKDKTKCNRITPILKSFLNYRHIETKPTFKPKKIIKIMPSLKGWLTVSGAEKNTKKGTISSVQSEYLNHRLKDYFDFDDIIYINKDNIEKKQHVFRLKRNDNTFDKLFFEFYPENRIWEFITSDYFKDFHFEIPYIKERALLNLTDSSFKMNKKSKIKNGYEEYEFEHPSIVSLGTNISPFFMFNLFCYGFKKVNNLYQSLITISPYDNLELKNQDAFIKLELGFWQQDYIEVYDEKIKLRGENGKPFYFEPKKYIEDNIRFLLEKEALLKSKVDNKKINEKLNDIKSPKQIMIESNQCEINGKLEVIKLKKQNGVKNA